MVLRAHSCLCMEASVPKGFVRPGIVPGIKPRPIMCKVTWADGVECDEDPLDLRRKTFFIFVFELHLVVLRGNWGSNWF